MKTLLLAALLALPCNAQDGGTDAPTVVRLTTGQPAPFDGWELTPERMQAVGDAVQPAQNSPDFRTVTIVGAVTFVLGVVAGAVAVAYLKR